MKLEKKGLSLASLKRAMRAELPTTRQRADTAEDEERMLALQEEEPVDALKRAMREAKAQGAWASENRVATAEDEERIAGLVASLKETLPLTLQRANTPEDEELEIAEATMKLEKKGLSLASLKRAMRAE